ncbi:MAG: SDR family oxidoreductase [Streptosporangiaceae bacterium]|nr:SDR family oxidoreductase [Streptosporangiaceae bacterium]
MSRPGSDESGAGRRAVITGGSRGLGLAVARRLAASGWSPTICGRDAGALERARLAAAGDGLALNTVAADVTCEESVRRMFSRLDADGPVHLCVSNAGANKPQLLVRRGPEGAVRRHPLSDWEETIRLCLTGVFLTGREAAAAMVARDVPGVIINISSAVRRGAYGQSAYTSAKAGVDALTRTWALELARYGIRVLGVAPGVIDGAALRAPRDDGGRHAAYMNSLREHIPLRRWAGDEEIAAAVCFAADHPYITGTVLEVDGGGVPEHIRT